MKQKVSINGFIVHFRRHIGGYKSMASIRKQWNIVWKSGVIILVYYTLTLCTTYWKAPITAVTTFSKLVGQLSPSDYSKTSDIQKHADDANYGNGTKYSPQCKTVSLMWKCQGGQEALQLFWSLKTILYYRSTPLKLHIVADDKAYSILHVMFETWSLPCVEITYHNSTLEVEKIAMTFSDEQRKVLHLPTTMRFMADIKELQEQVESQTTKVITQFPANWMVRPQLDHLIHISNPSDLKAFALEPDQVLYISTTGIMSKLEELFEVLKTDGSLLNHRHFEHCNCELLNNQVSISHSNISLDKECSKYTEYAYSYKRTLLYFFGSAKTSVTDDLDVSIVTQLTYDRMHILERYAKLWPGPMTVVIYVTDSEAFKLQTVLKQSTIISHRKNVDIHLVFKRKHLYPINQLRNLGIQQVKTPYCVFIDVDLLPNPTMYQDLKHHIKEYLVNQVNKTLIIPAFEAFEDLNPIPANKTIMLKHINEKKVMGYKMWRGWNLGHKPTDYPQWMKTNQSYIVQWRDAYEPYVVLKTSEMPLYEPALLERMGDKIAYGLHLYARGYEFRVLSDVFVIHIPHPVSEGTNVWKHEPGYSRCGARLFQAFKRDIFKVYPTKRY